jgi:hypothetical protein
VDKAWRFGGTYRQHFQSRRESQARIFSLSSVSAGFLFGLFFDHEGGGSKFFLNIGEILLEFTVSHFRG